MLNLTQHMATTEQIQAGVVEPTSVAKKEIQNLLTFNTIDETNEVCARADAIAKIAKEHGVNSAMIGGAPYLMTALEQALLNLEIKPYYAFTERVVEEVHTANGVEKKAVFRHVGFVPAFSI